MLKGKITNAMERLITRHDRNIYHLMMAKKAIMRKIGNVRVT